MKTKRRGSIVLRSPGEPVAARIFPARTVDVPNPARVGTARFSHGQVDVEVDVFASDTYEALGRRIIAKLRRKPGDPP